MSELVFVKLGGSLLTDKTRHQALRAEVLERLAREMAEAVAQRPDLKLLVGHGSGSYGHVVAQRYGTRTGVRTPQGWRGYAETCIVAAQLNRLVVDALWAAGLPVLPIQPSASAVCAEGELRWLAIRPIQVALDQRLVPVLYGDVALDDRQGGTIISTEQIFRWLAPQLAPQRVVLVGEVDGVYTADPAKGLAGELISEITPASFPQVENLLGSSRGIDVTGGMLGKVREMMALVEQTPSLWAVQIVSGLRPGLLGTVLTDCEKAVGTRICVDTRS